MNKIFKELLITGASLFMFAGVGASFSSMNHPAHASMPDPEYYHSTRQRHNVYYGIGRSKWGENVNYVLYGQMPKSMRKRGHIFPLYHGRKFNREIGGHQTSLTRTLYRNGQAYWPDYVGYLLEAKHDDGSDAQDRINYHGHKGYIEDIFINHKDIGRPLKNQNNMWVMNHDYLNSVHYLPVSHGHYRRVRRIRRRAYRKPLSKRHSIRTRRNARKAYRYNRRTRKSRKKVRKFYRKAKRIRHYRKHRARKSTATLTYTPVKDETSDQPSTPTQADDQTQQPSSPYWNQNGYPTDLALDDACTDLINDMNQERAEHGVGPLSSWDTLNQIASQRAGQLINNGFTHYDNNGNMYLTDDADNDGASLGDAWGENIGYTNGNTNETPQQIADDFTYMLYTKEKGATPEQDGGHRRNILNPNYTNVGVGINTDGNGNTYLAEDFCA